MHVKIKLKNVQIEPQSYKCQYILDKHFLFVFQSLTKY